MIYRDIVCFHANDGRLPIAINRLAVAAVLTVPGSDQLVYVFVDGVPGALIVQGTYQATLRKLGSEADDFDHLHVPSIPVPVLTPGEGHPPERET